MKQDSPEAFQFGGAEYVDKGAGKQFPREEYCLGTVEAQKNRES